MDFQTLCNTVGFWAAVRLTLTFIGVDFTSSVDGDDSVAIRTKEGARYVLWHNDQGAGEKDLGIRYTADQDCDDIRISHGIDDTFSMLGNVRSLVEGDISFDEVDDKR